MKFEEAQPQALFISEHYTSEGYYKVPLCRQTANSSSFAG